MRIGKTIGRAHAIAALSALLTLAGLAPAGATDPPDRAWLELGPLALMGSGPDRLEAGLGAFEPFDDDPALQGALEYRFGSKLGFVGPALGLLANDHGGIYGYFGLYLEVGLGALRLTPALAAGGYGAGDGPDLGQVLQFRESVSLAWQFDNGHRLGIKIAHISNANLDATNPGAEDLLVTYAVPLGPVF